MSAEQNKAIVRQAFDAINRNDPDALGEVVASDIADHDPAPGQGPGLEGLKGYFSSLHAAFPDLRMDIEDLIAEGDKVVARVKVSGTHQGEFVGIAPTGNRVTISGIDILRVTDGKVVEHWGRFDDSGMMQQLGVTEQPSG